MINDKLPDNLDLQYKPAPRQEEATPPPADTVHQEAGASSLYGRVGDNLTFHTQGAAKPGFFSLLWNWAWKDLGGAMVGLLRVFLPSREK